MPEEINVQPQLLDQWHYYIDTSTFGALVDDEEPERVKTTQMLFDRIASGWRQVQSACLMLGHRPIDIISPLEVIRDDT